MPKATTSEEWKRRLTNELIDIYEDMVSIFGEEVTIAYSMGYIHKYTPFLLRKGIYEAFLEFKKKKGVKTTYIIEEVFFNGLN